MWKVGFYLVGENFFDLGPAPINAKNVLMCWCPSSSGSRSRTWLGAEAPGVFSQLLSGRGPPRDVAFCPMTALPELQGTMFWEDERGGSSWLCLTAPAHDSNKTAPWTRVRHSLLRSSSAGSPGIQRKASGHGWRSPVSERKTKTFWWRSCHHRVPALALGTSEMSRHPEIGAVQVGEGWWSWRAWLGAALLFPLTAEQLFVVMRTFYSFFF